MNYQFEKYWSLNFFSIVNYKTLLDFLQDEDAIREFTAKFGYRLDDSGTLNPIPAGDPSKEHWHYYVNDNLKSNLELMNNQFVVYLATIIEACIGEFFLCLFVKYPERLHGYLKTFEEINSNLGFSINDLLKFDTKEEYLVELANRAANLFNSGKITDVIKRIRIVSGLEIETNLKNSIIEIVLVRNEIVHENKQRNLHYETLKEYSDKIEDLLKTISLKLYEMDIEVTDPGNLLELREDPAEFVFEVDNFEISSPRSAGILEDEK